MIDLLYKKLEEENLWEKELLLKRNDFLKNSNTIDTNLYYIVSGSFRIFVIDEIEESTIRFGYQKNFIVALDSFISEKPSDLCIQALKEAKVKSISKTKYMQWIRFSAENMKIWNELLAQLIFQQMERERDILLTSPLERYRRVLARSPQLFQEIPHKYIASYLRMSPETLSRIKKS